MVNISLSINFSPALSVPHGAGTGSAFAADSRQAAGAIADYMHKNGIDAVDPNQLYAMARNTRGDVPPDAQQGAAFMLKNPRAYQQIETHDRPGADGLSSVRNFEHAAEGRVSMRGAEPPPPACGCHAEQPSLDAQKQAASETLGSFMHASGMTTVDPNQLYALGSNKGGDVPQDVQAAATFMLQNPDVYQSIETADVPGADGLSGVWNFDKAAHATQTAPTLQPPVSQPAMGLSPFASPTAMPAPSMLSPTMQATGPAPSAQSPNLGAAMQLMPILSKLMQMLGMMQGMSTAGQAKSASGTLGGYMRSTGTRTMDPDKLADLAGNKGGNVPSNVRSAARFMLDNPGIYGAIETHDVKGRDGKSGAWNFEDAAKGQVAFA